ncbi:cytidylyltransferase domain-containing protein [Chloroflexota bacterium]
MASKIAVLIQVRMKSTRLPEKAMLMIEDKTIIEHVIDRLKMARTPDVIAICTSLHKDDAVLLEVARRKGIEGFAGSEEDVLDRFLQAAHWLKADIVVRASGEDPLVEPGYLDKTVEHHIRSGVDYTSTKQLPAGVAIEVISAKALEKAQGLADNSEMSEYMTLYFRDDFFKVEMVEVEEALKRPHYRLTVDTPEDLRLMREIYKSLYRPGEIVSLKEVTRFLDEYPELAEINSHRVPKRVRREVVIRQGRPKIRIVEE